MIRCSTCNVIHMRQYCSFFLLFVWLDTVEINRLQCPNDKMYDDVVFVVQFRYQLLCLEFCHRWGYLDSFMLILHMKQILKKVRSIQPNFLFFAWFVTAEFNRLPCSNNKMYDDMDFADWFRYQLTMFEVCILIPWYSYCMWNSNMTNHRW